MQSHTHSFINTNISKLSSFGVFRSNNIIKSKYNKNSYFYKQLNNGLKYLLVQDEKTDKSSAAFCINIGSLNDPDGFQGLAHFLEHMVFMGSKLYPGENEYNDFLTKNSGYSNAFTDFSMTNYYYESSNESFLEAFKMTSRFFIDPLLNESSVDREVNAVDSEFKNGLRDDCNRLQEILNKESNKDTPFKKFMCGNLQTLKKPGLIEALKCFFDKFYSADIITVVVYSHLDLNILEDKVDEILIEIPNKNLNKPFNPFLNDYSKINNSFTNHTFENYNGMLDNKPIKNTNDMNENNLSINTHEDVRNYVKNGKYAYDKNNLGILCKYAGIINKDRLLLEWTFNLPYNQYYKNKPLDFIVSLLSFKGSESFILNLINENLITDGSAYTYNYANTFTKLTIDLDLTEEGFKDYIEVIKRVISSIDKLKYLPVKKNFFEETKKISEISFEYHVDDDICDFVSSTAEKMHIYESQDCLYGDFMMQEFDEKLIKNFFEFLKNENLNIYLISDSFESLFENKEFIECSEVADLQSELLIKKYEDIQKMEVEETEGNHVQNNYFVKIRREEIYDSKYTLEKIDFAKFDLQSFKFKGLEKISYPAENKMIPETFNFAVEFNEIKNENSKLPPKTIYENENFTVHFKIDKAFYQPFIYLNAKIYLENLNIKNRNGIVFSTDYVTSYLSLWLTLLDKEIYERNSVANFACYYFDFYDNFNFLILKFSGYNDERKFAEFIHYIFDYFIDLHDISRIENFKTKILTLITESIKSLKNMDYDSASSQASEKFRELSLKRYCKKEINIKILEELKTNISEKNNWEDFEDLVTSYLDNTYINWLAQGHLSEKKALQYIHYISTKIQSKNQNNFDGIYSLNEQENIFFQKAFGESKMDIFKSNFIKTNCIPTDLIKFNKSKHYYHSFNSIDPKNKNCAIVTYFILGNLNSKEKCIAMLLQTMLSDEFFDDLRTQQCLGYTCSLFMRKYAKVDSFVCMVESSVKPPEYIANKITKFLHENNPGSSDEDEEYIEDFQKYKSSLIIDFKSKDFILANEVDRNFEEISSREYNFTKHQEWIPIIETLTLEDVTKFYEKYFIHEPCRVEIGFVSQNMIEENSKTLEKNLSLSYQDIVKEDDKKDENQKSSENDEESDEEEEEEESENTDSSVNVELPERVWIEDDCFKHSIETFNFNML